MTLQVLEIPEDVGQLADWLETRLLGLELGELVAELSAVHPAAAAATDSLEDVLGDQVERILVGGLKALPPESVKHFLVRPRLLLELQERVFVEGGPYWERVAAPAPEVEELIERGWRGLEEKLGNTEAAAEEEPATIPLPRRASWFARPWLVSLATAAAVLLGVFVYQHFAPPPAGTANLTAWGWNRTDALPQNVPAREYLDKLADEAGEWFAHRPEGDDRVALARSLAELREGCSVLILSDHDPLSKKTRDELVERCHKWAKQFDAQLAALEAGKDVGEVRKQTDATVQKLTAWLREEAEKAAA
jgi:hypothetical protein